MIAVDPSCAVAGCEREALGPHAGHLADYCSAHRYWQPVDHAERTCPGCDETYTPRRSDQLYCSKRCRHRAEARRNYVPTPRTPPRRQRLTCEVCGSAYLGAWGRYCSPRCTHRAWKARNRAAYLAGKARYRASLKGRD